MDIVLQIMMLTTSQYIGLPEGLLESVCYVESNFKPSAIHYMDGKSNSYGLCQIKLKTAKSMGFKGSKEELLIPSINILYAAKYLKYQLNRYHSISKAVIAYNRGAATKSYSNYQAKVFKVRKGRLWRNGLLLAYYH